MASLIQTVASLSNLTNAWYKIRHKPNSKGSDAETISKFAEDLANKLQTIRKELRENRYVFQPLLAQPIDKSGGGKRMLRIPTVRDRVVQKAIQLVIEPRLEKRYQINNEVSFAYMQGKSVRQAIKRVRKLFLDGYEWVYVADLKDFFGTIPPKKLVEEYVAPGIKNTQLCSLILDALKTDISNLEDMRKSGYEAYFEDGDVGIAQGVILSPLFSNLYLHGLDHAMIASDFEMIRFADDFIVMCRTQADAKKAEELARKILEHDLGLKLHRVGGKKSKIEKFNHLEFLGVRFKKDHLFPGTKRVEKMLQNLKEFQRKSPRKTFVANINFLRDVTSSWASDFYYMDLPTHTYNMLDNGIAFCLIKLMRNNGFVPKNPPYPLQDLEKLGIPTFSQRIYATKKKKIDDFNEFYS